MRTSTTITLTVADLDGADLHNVKPFAFENQFSPGKIMPPTIGATINGNGQSALLWLDGTDSLSDVAEALRRLADRIEDAAIAAVQPAEAVTA